MKYTKHLIICVVLALLQWTSGNETDSKSSVQALAINVESDDLEASESNIEEEIAPPVALKQVQFKDDEHYKHHNDEVTSETKESNNRLISRISVSTAYPTSMTLVTLPTAQAAKPVIKQNVFDGNYEKTAQAVIQRPTTNAKPRMVKKEVKKPMFYKIIKKVEYGPKKIQRRHGFGQDNKVAVRPVSYPTQHNVRFYIKPKNHKAPNGGKIFIPIMPKPHDQIPKWAVGQYGNYGYKGSGPVQSWQMGHKTPTSHVSFKTTIAKKPKTYGPHFVNAGVQYGSGQQYHQYPEIPAHTQYSHEVQVDQGTFAAEHGSVLPDWSQGLARPPFHQAEATPEFPEWAPQETSFESDAGGFSPLAMAQVYPAQFGNGPSQASSGSHSGTPNSVSFEEYNPSMYQHYPQGNPGFAQLQGHYQQSRPSQQAMRQPPVRHYAVEEQLFDVPPPSRHRPMSQQVRPARPQNYVHTQPPSAPQIQTQAHVMSQSPLQAQYNQLHQLQSYAQMAHENAGAQSGELDYSAYQPKPAHINSPPSYQSQQEATIQTPSPVEYTNNYPALSSIQDFSPNYLRESPEQYKYGEGAAGAEQAWSYQPSQEDYSQWAQQTLAAHSPNLQAAYAWQQRTQDGKLIQVAHNGQESRTEVTKVQPEPNHTHHYSQPAPNHSRAHHEIVKKQVTSAAPQAVNSVKEDESSQEIITEAPPKQAQVVAPSTQKDSMISNGWTPIINN